MMLNIVFCLAVFVIETICVSLEVMHSLRRDEVWLVSTKLREDRHVLQQSPSRSLQMSD